MISWISERKANESHQLTKLKLQTMPLTQCNKTTLDYNKDKHLRVLRDGIRRGQYCVYDSDATIENCGLKSGAALYQVLNRCRNYWNNTFLQVEAQETHHSVRGISWICIVTKLSAGSDETYPRHTLYTQHQVSYERWRMCISWFSKGCIAFHPLVDIICPF